MKWKKFLSTIICMTMIVATPVESTLAESLQENPEIAEEYQFEEKVESNEYWIEENAESVSDGLTDSAEISDGFEDGTADNWEVNEFESDPQEEEKQTEDEIAGFADAQNTEEANADDSLTLEERDQKLQEMVEKIITYLDLEEKSEYEKIYAIYNYVCENVEYDYSVLDKENNWDGVSLGYGQFAYEALCEGKAVCAGIARGIVELMESAGIECHYIDGWAQNGITHAWNLVRIGDLYYYIDATTDLGQENYHGFLKGSNDWGRYQTAPSNDLSKFNISETAYEVTAGRQLTQIGDYTVNVGLGAITIYSYNGNEEEVVVPAEIGGRKVKKLKQNTFERATQLTSLIISEGIEQVESGFASDCQNLEKIVLPATANLVSPYALAGLSGLVDTCRSLKKITVAEGNPYLVVIDDVLYNKDCTELIAYPPKAENEVVKIADGVTDIKSDAFAYNTSLKKVIFPDSVIKIGYWAFQFCRSLEEINIPPHCKLIGQFAFSQTKIKKIKIPAEVEEAIMEAAFYGAPIEKIEVEEGNTYYYVKDGALYTADKTLLLYETEGEREEFKVPDDINYIGQGAFSGAKNLKKVELGTSVERIGGDAFSECTKLQEVEATKSKIFEIGNYAFMSCGNLISVNLPDSVVEIGNLAFCQCMLLNEISLPQSLQRIGTQAFFNCQNLQCVEIPASLEVIGENIFGGLCGLRNIFFRGSQQQWESIEKNGNSFEYVNIHFNSTMCQHEWEDSIRIKKYPTCAETGLAAIYCKKCSSEKGNSEVVIPKSNAHQWVDQGAIREAGCTESGEESYFCRVCWNYKTEAIPPTGHQWNNGEIVQEASTTSEGLKRYTCNRCGMTRDEIIEKKKSNPTESDTFSISVSSKKITVAVGKSIAAPQVTYKKGDYIVSWKSANPSIASVTKKGKITGKKVGKTTITVTLKSKKSAKITVVVAKKIPTTSLKVAKKSLKLKKGKTYQLKVTVKPVNTTDKLSFKSSNTKIVTVSSKGKLKAKKKGKATITIISGKKKVTCKVTVK